VAFIAQHRSAFGSRHNREPLWLDGNPAFPLVVEPGDVLVAQCFARSNPVSGIEDGWTLVGEQGRQIVWVKEVTEDALASYPCMQ